MSEQPEPALLTAAQLDEAFRRIFDAPMQPHVPLLSPRCGLHDQHGECRAVAICECRCHWPSLPA